MARGFGIGDFAKAFNTTYDTVNKVAQDFEVAKIVNEKPIDATGLSTEQNEQVFQSLADGGTARDVQNDDGSFGGVAISKPMAEGVEGQAQTKTYEPQKITKYLGRDFVGGLDPAQATRARNRALAGVITKSNPLQGIQLDAALTQTERQDQEYGEKQQVGELRKQFTAERDPFKRAEIGRQLAALPGGGDVVKGFGDIEQANLRAVVNHARGFLSKGDMKGAMGVYNAYDNGGDGEVVELPGGGYQLNFYQGKPGESNLSGSKTFKTADDLRQWFDDQFDQDAAAKRRAEAAANQLKFSQKVAEAVAVEQAKGIVRGDAPRAGYRFMLDEDGERIQVPVNGDGTPRTWSGSGSGSSGGKKAPKTPAEQLDDHIKDIIGGVNGQNNPLTLEQSSLLRVAANDALRLNPGMDPRLAAQAGLSFSMAEPGKTMFSLDPSTGMVVEQVQTPQGLVAINQVTHRNAAARQMPPEKIKLAVESSIGGITGGDASKRAKVIAAAFDTTGKARRALLEDAKTELMSMPQFRALSREGQAEALRAHERNVDKALAVPLGWIRNFGQDLNQ